MNGVPGASVQSHISGEASARAEFGTGDFVIRVRQPRRLCYIRTAASVCDASSEPAAVLCCATPPPFSLFHLVTVRVFSVSCLVYPPFPVLFLGSRLCSLPGGCCHLGESRMCGSALFARSTGQLSLHSLSPPELACPLPLPGPLTIEALVIDVSCDIDLLLGFVNANGTLFLPLALPLQVPPVFSLPERINVMALSAASTKVQRRAPTTTPRAEPLYPPDESCITGPRLPSLPVASCFSPGAAPSGRVRALIAPIMEASRQWSGSANV